MTTAHHYGSLALSDVGSEIWSTERVDDRGDAIGGVCIASELSRADDEDDPVRTFLVLNAYKTGRIGQLAGAFRHLRETEVDPETVTTAPSSRLTNLTRHLCAEVAFTAPGRPRKGLLTPDQAAWVSYAHRLTTVLMAGPR